MGPPVIHSIIHVVSLISIVGLLSSYVQLKNRFEDLSQSCIMHYRAHRDVSQGGGCFSGNSDDMNDSLQKRVASVTTEPIILTSSSSFFKAELKNERTFAGTETSEVSRPSLSISHSLFDSSRLPFETSKTLAIDDFGKTDESSDTAELQASSTDVISAGKKLETSFMEITRQAEQGEDRREIVQETLTLTERQRVSLPSTLVDKELVKHNSASDIPYPHSHEIQTEKSTSSGAKSKIDKFLLQTSSTMKSFAASETGNRLRLFPKNEPVQEKGNLDHIHSGTENSRWPHHMSAILATDSGGEDGYYLDDSKFCQSHDCRMAEDELDIAPVRVENEPHVGDSVDEDDEIASGLDDSLPVSNLFVTAELRGVERLKSQGTSAKCTYQADVKSCYFQNLCYKSANNEFVFLKGSKSFVEDSSLQEGADIVELFNINLSTVPDHNAHMFSLAIIPSESLHRFSSVAVSHWTSVLMSRFKPDNIMHVLHDDVLPLFHTLHSHSLIHNPQKSNVAIIFTDQFGYGEFPHFYSALSSVLPSPLWKLNSTAELLCFSNVHVGIRADTLWYQYGFIHPQGPLRVNNSEILTDIRRAVDYLAEHFQTACFLCKNRDYLVLLSRKDNRLILNEGELVLALARSTKLKVMSVSIETHSLGEIISIVRNSKGIIGMHGSLLIFAVFLQSGSIVIELFPYGVNSSKYTPFKTYCDLPGSGIVYKSWTNQDKSKSVPHPDWLPELGGIHHLPQKSQEIIVSQSEVPDHLCCENPSWLYHIYQDTELDIPAVLSLASEALVQANITNHRHQRAQTELSTIDLPVLPGRVSNLACQYEQSFYHKRFAVSWQLPWNLNFISYSVIETDLVIQKCGTDHGRHVKAAAGAGHHVKAAAGADSYSFELSEMDGVADYNIWVRVTLDDIRSGPYSYTLCKLEE